MNEEGGLFAQKQFPRWLIITTISSVILVAAGYIVLQTLCKPYFVVGQKIMVGLDYYQIITVVNPGPWSTREPAVEFTTTSGDRVVDYSAGVTVEVKHNKTIAKMDNGLPAGSIFSVTYFHSATNLVSGPEIVCDAKICKQSPTFDMDLTFKAIILVGASFGVIALVCSHGWVRARQDLRSEKDSAVSNALSTLLSREQAQGDVNKAAQTVADLPSVVQKADIKATPVKKTENGKKKDKAVPPVKPDPAG